MSQNADQTPPAGLEKVADQPENPFIKLIPDQEIVIVPSFTLESGVTLYNVPIAYTTRGKLNWQADNAMIICHALTGSADVADWWGPLMGGQGRAFDVTRFFVVCLNTLGSPYGSASPVTNKDGDPSKGRYGPEFPLTTIRDDVNIHRIVLEWLGVKQIAAVVGGSMGGMAVLEWAYFGKEYVRTIVPIATCSRHSAWGISWGEAQRQSIYCDPKYEDGYYPFEDPPASGLSAARMSALLTYRSRDSFQSRFGRNVPDPSRKQNITGTSRPETPAGQVNEHWKVHNEGHKNEAPVSTRRTSISASPTTPASPTVMDPQFSGGKPLDLGSPLGEKKSAGIKKKPTTYFSAQSYLRYQGQKFVKRFDPNCYLSCTRKLDTHDVSRGRVPEANPSDFIAQQAQAIAEGDPTATLAAASPDPTSSEDPIMTALGLIQQPTLVIGIESDGLFTFAEQQELAAGIPNSRLRRIDSPEGHDAFLLQFEQVNIHLLEFFKDVLPEIMDREPDASVVQETGEGQTGFVIQKTSTFGEAEIDDITAW